MSFWALKLVVLQCLHMMFEVSACFWSRIVVMGSSMTSAHDV